MMAPLVALTVYYNPFGVERRRRNYHVFRRNLDIPLVTVEWAHDGRFELASGDAELLIRVEGGDLLWQKERLLNHGLANIRSHSSARDVVLIDADAVFAEPGWPARISAQLQTFPLIQTFSRVDYLPPLAPGALDIAQLAAITPERSLPSIASAMAQGSALFDARSDLVRAMAPSVTPVSGIPGMSIALRLEALPGFELYDGNIVGGGDQVLIAAALGRLDEHFHHRPLAPGHQADIRAWARRCLPTLPGLGLADNRVLHLWHGAMEGRQYGMRHQILRGLDYDPRRDLDRSGEALRFASGTDGLKAAVEAYLVSRRDA
ncbi:MAG: hypothetical protein V4669_01355 [Pseudomonadota bacterium]